MRTERPVEAYWDAEVCECGGLYDSQYVTHTYTAYPLQADFKCSNCGKIKRLFENEFPGVKHRFKEEKK